MSMASTLKLFAVFSGIPSFLRQSSYVSCLCSRQGRKLWTTHEAVTKGQDEEPKRSSVARTIPRAFEILTVETFKEIIDSERDLHLIQSILDDYDYLKQTTDRVPSSLNVAQMKKAMIEMESFQARERYFYYLYKTEMSKLNRKIQSAKRRIESTDEEHLANAPKGISYYPETNKPIYGLWKNSIFVDFTKKVLEKRYETHLLSASMFGQPLIFDFSYESYMTGPQKGLLVKQISEAYGLNKACPSAFQLWFCNYTPDSQTDDFMSRCLPTLRQPKTFINVENRSYLDIFPKKNLIYLSPDAGTSLTTYDPDAIYIIGALFDLNNSKKYLSVKKAQEKRIKARKLPLDDYLLFKASTSLNVHDVMKILLTVKKTHDWTSALSFVSSKKLESTKEILKEQERRMKIMISRET